jgi:hypothetical protein
MGANKPALKTLSTLLIAVGLIFCIEQKFLVNELRGETISHYNGLKWVDQLIFLVDDFEGLSDTISLKNASFFVYGNAKMTADSSVTDKSLISSKTCISINWNGAYNYGGWGKGCGKNIDLNAATDYVNFRVFIPAENKDTTIIKIMLEEDDNFNGTLDQDQDDSWYYKAALPAAGKWQMVSVPLKNFTDGNTGGDGQLNITRKGGLHTIIFAFDNPDKYTPEHKWYFDFICFSNGTIKE